MRCAADTCSAPAQAVVAPWCTQQLSLKGRGPVPRSGGALMPSRVTKPCTQSSRTSRQSGRPGRAGGGRRRALEGDVKGLLAQHAKLDLVVRAAARVRARRVVVREAVRARCRVLEGERVRVGDA